MSRDSFDYGHGDTGTKPTNPLNFEAGERPIAGNFDWWWTTVINSIDGHADEFDRLDSDDDGVVDAADGAATWSADGTEKASYPTDVNFTGDLQLTDDGDGTVTLHLTRYTDTEARSAVDGSNVSITGDADTVDGEDASAFADAGHLHDSRYVMESGDKMGGQLTVQRAEGSHYLTAEDTTSSDKLSVKSETGGGFLLTGYDSSAGTWQDSSSLEYTPSNTTWNFRSMPTVQGNDVATQSWVNSNADVPNADHADSATDADTVGGREISHGTSAPSNPDQGDIWIDTS